MSLIAAPPLGPGDAITLISHQQYVALAVVVVTLLVRMLKSPSAPGLLGKIPPKARPAIALLLGVLLGCLEAVTKGTRWQDALIGGLVSGAIAVLGHDVFIEWLRSGKEVFPQVSIREVQVDVPVLVAIPTHPETGVALPTDADGKVIVATPEDVAGTVIAPAVSLPDVTPVPGPDVKEPKV